MFVRGCKLDFILDWMFWLFAFWRRWGWHTSGPTHHHSCLRMKVNSGGGWEWATKKNKGEWVFESVGCKRERHDGKRKNTGIYLFECLVYWLEFSSLFLIQCQPWGSTMSDVSFLLFSLSHAYTLLTAPDSISALGPQSVSLCCPLRQQPKPLEENSCRTTHLRQTVNQAAAHDIL